MPSTRRRGLATAAALATAVILLSAGCESTAQTGALKLVNKDRAAHGVAPVLSDAQLMHKAQAWADHLAATGVLAHSTTSAGVTGCWKGLGENVGVGSSISAVQDTFIADVGFNPPLHRNNIRNGAYDRAGTGVAKKGSKVFVVQVFKDAC